MPQVPNSINLARFFRADPYRAGVVALGLIWATLIQQGLPYWDAGYENIFKPTLAKPLIGHIFDVLSPASTDAQDRGFMDRTEQFAFYSFSHLIAGYNSWPCLLLRIFSLAILGGAVGAVYRWGLRVLTGRAGDRLAAAVAALFPVVRWNLYWAYRNDGEKTKALRTVANMKALFPADPEMNRLIANRF